MKNVWKFALVLMLSLGLTTWATTIAYWNFEDGVAGQPFTPEGAPNGSGGSLDTVNNYMMRGWDSYYGPSWTTHTPSGQGLAMRNAEFHQDGYCFDDDLLGWAPEVWTIEATVKLIGGVADNRWQTFIGRDGSADPGVDPESVFYLQKTWDNYFRINIRTEGGQRALVTSTFQMEADKWYSLVAQSDGSTLYLWVNDYAANSGWMLAGSTALTGEEGWQNALAWIPNNWTFGRGWYNTWFVDHIDGYMDEIRFSEAFLSPEEFIWSVPEPASMLLLGLGGLVSLRKKR